ncbi:hypothetical protein SAMN05421835_108188 [Amycolatopsis sacchari]|uniref:Uncharacterized protein n=1 Tax=Amycolatopsis sacchari TaxID=115433 RepID=A0A1I3U1C5_9PSEU|nr:hypothetical protein [Amycolatopsis sacchari]SFJ76702.1 hypothetical protein SAMN05421835_108188 [Amycolatopsis sacchari]
MSGIPSGASPARLKTLAIRRYEATTGRRWREAPEADRAAWLADTEPEIRAEEGIAADAVWHAGTWIPAGQTDLFTSLPDHSGTETSA